MLPAARPGPGKRGYLLGVLTFLLTFLTFLLTFLTFLATFSLSCSLSSRPGPGIFTAPPPRTPQQYDESYGHLTGTDLKNGVCSVL